MKQKQVTLNYVAIMNVLNRAQEVVALSYENEPDQLRECIADLEDALQMLSHDHPTLPVDAEVVLRTPPPPQQRSKGHSALNKLFTKRGAK